MLSMAKKYLTVSMLFLLLSCNEVEKSKDHTYQFYSIQFEPASQLVLAPQVAADSTLRYYDYQVEYGNNTVFTLTYSRGDSIATDSGVSDIVVFEVDSSTTDFEAKGKNLKNYNVLNEERCFCAEAHSNRPVRMSEGEIQGIRIDPLTWFVKVKVGMIDLEDTVKVNQKKIISLK